MFMTHVTNYAVDRLALELFDKLFTFVQEWTNIQLVSDSPLTLGRKYFEIFPEDKTPFWTVSGSVGCMNRDVPRMI